MVSTKIFPTRLSYRNDKMPYIVKLETRIETNIVNNHQGKTHVSPVNF